MWQRVEEEEEEVEEGAAALDGLFPSSLTWFPAAVG